MTSDNCEHCKALQQKIDSLQERIRWLEHSSYASGYRAEGYEKVRELIESDGGLLK